MCKQGSYLVEGGVRAPPCGHDKGGLLKNDTELFLHREVRAMNGISHQKTRSYMIEQLMTVI